MRKVMSFLRALVSVLMVSTSLSASACDLSCWLHQAPSDCHSGSSATATEGGQQMTSASSAMDMSSKAGMSSPATQSNAGADYRVNGSAHHSMAAQMNIVRSPVGAIRKSDTSSSATFGHSFDPTNGVSLCSHETCSQASTSVSPPWSSRAQPAYLHGVAFRVSIPPNLLTSPHRIAPAAPPPINLAVDILAALRI